jgi:hypothetical protein
MGTKVNYIYCRRCGALGPSPGYFHNKLHPDHKDLCIWCIDKIFKQEPEKQSDGQQSLFGLVNLQNSELKK